LNLAGQSWHTTLDKLLESPVFFSWISTEVAFYRRNPR